MSETSDESTRKCSLQQILVRIFLSPEPRLQIHHSSISPDAMLITRVISLLYLSGFYLFDFWESESLLFRFLYLTNIGYFMTWLYFLLALQARLIKRVSGLEPACEILFQTVFCIEVFISVSYWCILYTMGGIKGHVPLYMDLDWHAVPTSLLLVEFALCSYRFLYKQYAAVAVVCLSYGLCINLPYALLVEPVYGRAADWKEWITYAFMLGLFVFTFMVFAFGRLIFCKFKSYNPEEQNKKLCEGAAAPNTATPMGSLETIGLEMS